MLLKCHPSSHSSGVLLLLQRGHLYPELWHLEVPLSRSRFRLSTGTLWVWCLQLPSALLQRIHLDLVLAGGGLSGAEKRLLKYNTTLSFVVDREFVWFPLQSIVPVIEFFARRTLIACAKNFVPWSLSVIQLMFNFLLAHSFSAERTALIFSCSLKEWTVYRPIYFIFFKNIV